MKSLLACYLQKLLMFLTAPFAFMFLLAICVAILGGMWIGILFMQPVKVNRDRYKLKWK